MTGHWSPRDVTVAVCTRNRPDLLRTCLRQLRESVAADVDVLVVDSASDGSGTREVCAEFAVRYVRCDRSGLSVARNRALTETDSEIVLFTDDDCLLGAGVIEALVLQFSDPAVGCVTGRLVDHAAINAADTPGAPRTTALIRPLQGLDAGHGALMAFRRELLLELGGFDPLLGAGRHFASAEDTDMFCRVLAAGRQVVVDRACRVVHANTRSRADYLQLQRGYGLGVGAMCVKWIRADLRTGAEMTARVSVRGLRRWVRGRGAYGRRPAALFLVSIWRGLWQAWALPREGPNFTDSRTTTTAVGT